MMGHIVVCGLGRFGLTIVEALRSARRGVTVITDARTNQDRIDRATAAGATIVAGDFRRAGARRAANLHGAAGVLLTTSNDVDNLETALEIRDEVPMVPVVMRHSEPRLNRRLEADFGIHAAMSPALIAADVFVQAALEAPSPQVASGRHARRIVVPRPFVRPEYVLIPAVLLAIYGVAIVVFRASLGLDWIDAAYFATSIVTTVGFGDFNLQHAPVAVKLFGIALMFAGIVLIAIISSLLTIVIVSGTADQVLNAARARRLHDHVVVCGIGQVGSAVARDLRRRGVRVAIVDPAAFDDDHRELRLRCPVIVGDATRPAVLGRAGIDRARALVACTANDALNLEIGLTAQSILEGHRGSRPLRLVLRCFDADVARRIHAVSADYTLLSEAQIAAPVFVRRAIEAAETASPRDAARGRS